MLDNNVPAEQKAVVGGARPFVVSTQLSRSAFPVPVVDVIELLLEKVTAGGAVGNMKSCDA
jgi:hypothetical protein